MPDSTQDLQNKFVSNIVSLATTGVSDSSEASPVEKVRRVLTKSATPITSPHQIVAPNIAWDWPVAATGTIDFEQFQFCDLIPQSLISGQEYVPSSNSFTSNYRAYLDFIDESKFPSKTLLDDAKESIKKPTGSPASSPAKEGWTKVSSAGVDRWEPIWSLSDTPSNWIAKVKSGAISNPGSFSLNLKKNSDSVITTQTSTGQSLSALPENYRDLKKVVVSAKAWGQITISPGDWYNSSLLKLGQSYVESPELFFGPKGLLRGRVSAILVAYQPQFKLQTKRNLASEIESNLTQETDLHILGVPVEVKTGGEIADSKVSLKLENTSEVPVIVAVLLDQNEVTE